MDLSMSMLDEFLRCRRKWYYHYGLGFEGKDSPDYIWIGSAFHAAVAAAYARFIGENGLNIDHFLTAAHLGLDAWVSANPQFPLDKLGLVHDMIDYWWHHDGAARALDYDSVLSVEQHIPLKVGDHVIRCTPDLIARTKNRKLIVPDHKTVGDIRDSLAFLPLDFQLKCYALTVWDEYGEIPEVHYNMVRRELPPDYERVWDLSYEKPYLLTPTGRKSTRSCDPKDYLRYEVLTYTAKQLIEFSRELNEIVAELTEAIEKKRFVRSRSKAGAFGCGGCSYLAACTREADGEKLDGITISLEFNKRPDPVFMLGEVA